MSEGHFKLEGKRADGRVKESAQECVGAKSGFMIGFE